MIDHELYMRRCIELAKFGAGNVAPNPMVGAVLVYDDRIIGEGLHEKYGEAHAEVNCIKSVSETNRQFISSSTLYVSLEPCSHFGKTPPCADLIVEHKIPHIVIGCRDSFEKVNGTGIEKLLAAGIKVDVGILENDCRILNKRFFTFHPKKRPYIILKWAQSQDGFIAGENSTTTKISNGYTDKLVHQWRSEEAAILVGANTVRIDNPNLTTRNWIGNHPVRIIIDEQLSLPKSSNVFDDMVETIIINRKKHYYESQKRFHKIEEDVAIIDGIMECLYQSQLNSVIIEGGAKTLQLFIDAGLWDEARIITNTTLYLNKGLKGPLLSHQNLHSSFNIFSDRVDFFLNNSNDAL